MVRKVTLSRAVRIMQNLFPEEYNFYPRSWILPDEFQLFVAQVDGWHSEPMTLELYYGCSCVLGPVLGAKTGQGECLTVHSRCWQQSWQLADLNREGDR